MSITTQSSGSTTSSNRDSTTTTTTANTNNNNNNLNMSISTEQLDEPGWRVEFRSLELQLTDFENAAFSIIILLLSKTILHNKYNFMIPMSYVHENMRRAQLKDAVLTQKFWFRRNILEESSSNSPNSKNIPSITEASELVELSIDEIMNGMKLEKVHKEKNSPFPGVLSLINSYIKNNLNSNNIINTIDNNNDVTNINPTTTTTTTTTNNNNNNDSNDNNIISTPSTSLLDDYLELIRLRSSGRLPTTARWMRNFVLHHPQYIPNSGIISSTISNDLLRLCSNIGLGIQSCIGLYGTNTLKHIENLSIKLKNKKSENIISDILCDNKKKRKNIITSSSCSVNKNNYNNKRTPTMIYSSKFD